MIVPPPGVVIVDRHDFRLRLWTLLADESGYEKARVYKVAVGMVGLATPGGAYLVTTRSDHPDYTYPDSEWVPEELRGLHLEYGDPRNPIAERWLGLGADGVGIHGTFAEDSVGTRASHGCVRMRAEDVIDLYDLVPKGTPVLIY